MAGFDDFARREAMVASTAAEHILNLGYNITDVIRDDIVCNLRDMADRIEQAGTTDNETEEDARFYTPVKARGIIEGLKTLGYFTVCLCGGEVAISPLIPLLFEEPAGPLPGARAIVGATVGALGAYKFMGRLD